MLFQWPHFLLSWRFNIGFSIFILIRHRLEDITNSLNVPNLPNRQIKVVRQDILVIVIRNNIHTKLLYTPNVRDTLFNTHNENRSQNTDGVLFLVICHYYINYVCPQIDSPEKSTQSKCSLTNRIINFMSPKIWFNQKRVGKALNTLHTGNYESIFQCSMFKNVLRGFFVQK